MKIAIFGGAGEVGSKIARHLLETTDADVVAIDNLSSGSMDALGYLHSNPRFSFYLGDVSDIYFVELVTADVTHVINCVNCADPDRIVSTLVVGTQNILECLCPEQQYIHVGEYAYDPSDLYETCHYAAEGIVRSYNKSHKYHSKIIYTYNGDESIVEEVLEIIFGNH